MVHDIKYILIHLFFVYKSDNFHYNISLFSKKLFLDIIVNIIHNKKPTPFCIKYNYPSPSQRNFNKKHNIIHMFFLIKRMFLCKINNYLVILHIINSYYDIFYINFHSKKMFRYMLRSYHLIFKYNINKHHDT